MKKELVLVKDLNNFWTCALCVTCTEGKHLTNVDAAIEIIKNEYADMKNAEFIIENNDVFAIIAENAPQVNPGQQCK
jgi:hypothetical protein